MLVVLSEDELMSPVELDVIVTSVVSPDVVEAPLVVSLANDVSSIPTSEVIPVVVIPPESLVDVSLVVSVVPSTQELFSRNDCRLPQGL